jgi:hypothetical protein
MKKTTLLILAFALMAGCAAPNKFPPSAYKGGLEYPYISLLVNDGYVYQSTSCSQYGCQTYVDQTHLFLLNCLRESGKFERVDMNNGLAKNKLIVDFKRESDGSEAGDFGKMMLGALTIFLLPMPYDYTYQAKLSVMNGDKITKEYQYRLKSSEFVFLFTETQSAKNNAIKSIVDNFLKDLEEDGTQHLFSSNP